MNDRTIRSRPVGPDDDGLLRRLFASTREAELSLVDWDASQKDAFLRMQFDAQRRHYEEHYPGASFQVVLVDGAPAGRLSVARWPEEVRVVDIALLPEYRNIGVGTVLLRRILCEAGAEGKRVTVHVDRVNPARRLYERLGFTSTTDDGVHILMTCLPPSAPSTPG